MNEELEKQNGPGVGSWIWLIIGILYAVSPVDILPDVVPFAGWVDDLIITGTGVLNFIQAEVGKSSQTLSSILGMFKWIVLILGVIAILLVALIGGLIFKMFS
ncbi:MAG: DUF1232 domain-containing protein [Paludibacteraceae bacterium]|nr:DUF1232 domain-containing protein [Paludibacteraceae bacterium]